MAEPGVHARFYKFPVLNGFKSQAEGRPIYEDKDFVEIRVAGDARETFTSKVRPVDVERFPEEWAAYQRGDTQKRAGTPLEQWPAMTPAQIKNLEFLNIFTVEDLASLSDAGLQKVGMGANKMRSDAQKYLEMARQISIANNNEESQKRIAELEAQVKALLEGREGQPKKRGRKPKQE